MGRLQARVVDAVRSFYNERLTARGRYLIWTVAMLAVLGMDTRSSKVHVIFAVAAAPLLVGALFAVLPPPRVRFSCPLPEHATAGTPVTLRARIESERGAPDLRLSFPRPSRWGSSISFQPRETLLDLGREDKADVAVALGVARRGRYLLRGPTVRRTDPLRLVTGRPRALPDQNLVAYPRFFPIHEFAIPIGRRYQPGGIPLSSSLGEAIEFVGTRDYRQGDSLRNVHWRSWARRGTPVVKEYQEEYFCRIALILDTFVPGRPDAEATRGFEAAISVAASIADYFSRSEYVVDVLAAGPDLYEVSAGRSLAYLENVLDVLACLEPCKDPPFATIGPALFEKLGQITTVVVVLQDWDDARESFLRRVKALGTALRVVVVREGKTSRPWQADDLGEMEAMTPTGVEAAIRRSAPVAAPAPASAPALATGAAR